MDKILSLREKVMLTVPEVALLIGVSRAKAYELVASGEIPSKKLGPRCTKVSREALEVWAKGGNNDVKAG